VIAFGFFLMFREDDMVFDDVLLAKSWEKPKGASQFITGTTFPSCDT
jgi:hypothetical protein